MKIQCLTAILAGALTMAAGPAADKKSAPTPPDIRHAMTRLEREVRHELIMLPYYGVFDNLGFRVSGGMVTLMGQVTQPTLKSSAERVVRDIPGVTSIVNNIEVLPLSGMDDQIRIAVYQAIYRQPSLQRYAMWAIPPIHIIVKNGSVTLVGIVATQMDKQIAGIQAGSVPDVFSVKNELLVEKPLE